MKNIIKSLLDSIGILKYIYRVRGYRTPNEINFLELEKRHRELVEKCRKKQKVTVAFFLYYSSTWKYDKVSKIMEDDENFEPIIVVIPILVWDKIIVKEEMNKTFNWFNKRGYNVYKSYNQNDNTYLNIEKVIKPDIVFFSEPYDATAKQYRSYVWKDKALLCYSVYGFNMSIHTNHLYNLYFHNVLWKNFIETKYSKLEIEKYAFNKGKNAVFTGSPACDYYLDRDYIPKNIWKNTKFKRVIYSPHFYTIDDTDDGWATFSKNHQIMIDIAQAYKKQIYFIFKPHPYLKATLYKHKDWGKKRTDEYFLLWENMENSHIEMEDYVDLFLTSDGLINDSGSFVFEYLFTFKPSLFLYKDEKMKKRWNQNAIKALEVTYSSHTKEEIIKFLDSVILDANDTLKQRRADFVYSNLIPPNGVSASENIVLELKKELNK